MYTIDKLWYEYLSTEALVMTDEQKELTDKLTESVEALGKSLNEEQKTEFDLCNSYLSDIDSISIKQAFSCGFKFATRLLFEALEK